MVNKQKIAFIGNQGGKLVYDFYYEVHKNLFKTGTHQVY